MRTKQIKKAIRILRKGYKKQWPHSLLVTLLLHDHLMAYVYDIKPDDTPF